MNIKLNKYFLLSLTSLVVVYSILFFTNKNFFFIDDASSLFLPITKLQYETFIQNLQIPFINYYQYLGDPLLQQGLSGALFLPRYIFYLISEVIHQPQLYITLESFSFSLIGFIGVYKLLKKYNIKTEISSLAALAYSTNGFLFQLGGSWAVISGYFGFLPWLFLLNKELKNERENIYKSAVIRALIFYIGYTNFFVYIVFFELLFFILNKPGVKLVLKFVESLILTSILCLPLLLPILQGLILSSRFAGYENQFFGHSEIINIIFGSFTPGLGIKSINEPALIYFNSLIFVTTLLLLPLIIKKIRQTILVLAAVLIGYLVNMLVPMLHLVFLLVIYRYLGSKKVNNLYLFATLTILGILLSLGNQSPVSYILFPLIIFFRWPFKWYFLVQFTGVIFIALALNSHLAKLNAKKLVALLALMIFANILIYSKYIQSYSPGFSSNQNKSKVINLIEKNYRLVSFGYEEIEFSSKLLGGDLPTQEHIFALGGYNAVVAAEKQNLIDLNFYSVYTNPEDFLKHKSIFKEFGVKNILVAKNFYSQNKDVFEKDTTKVAEDGEIILLYLNDPLPLVFDQNGSEINFEVHGNNLIAKLPKTNTSQTVTFSWMKLDDNWVAKAGNKNIVVDRDRLKRITVNVPAGADVVTLSYVDKQFYTGAYISISMLVLWFIVNTFRMRRGTL